MSRENEGSFTLAELWWSRDIMRAAGVTDVSLRPLTDSALDELGETAYRIAQNVEIEKAVRRRDAMAE